LFFMVAGWLVESGAASHLIQAVPALTMWLAWRRPPGGLLLLALASFRRDH
jgi:hypothetical protein